MVSASIISPLLSTRHESHHLEKPKGRDAAQTACRVSLLLTRVTRSGGTERLLGWTSARPCWGSSEAWRTSRGSQDIWGVWLAQAAPSHLPKGCALGEKEKQENHETEPGGSGRILLTAQHTTSPDPVGASLPFSHRAPAVHLAPAPTQDSHQEGELGCHEWES